jgi:dienelactone hydrolase
MPLRMTAMRLFLSSIVLALPLISSAAEVHESVERSGSAGVTERALIVRSDESPVREVLLVFSGGDGYLGLRDTPPSSAALPGFTGSLRRLLVRPGTALVLLDSPAQQPRMSVEYRESPEYRAWIAGRVAQLRERFAGAKLYAVGYSNGAVSALIAGGQPGVAGVMLIGGIFRLNSDLASFGVEVPILIVHHEADRCVPPEFDEPLRRVRKPTIVRSVAQPYDPEPCGPVSAHQFYKQEQVVANVVHGWLDTGRAPLRTQ